MNGIIHNSAQEVYGYGSFSFPKENACDKKVYSLVWRQIDRMVIQFKPKELILCIDGVAPRSKQIQQRQRRFWPRMIEKNQAQNLTLIVIREIQVNLTQTLFPQEPNLCITLEDILTFILNRSKNQRLPGGKLPMLHKTTGETKNKVGDKKI